MSAIRLSEAELVLEMKNLIDECDADTLGHLAGLMFGGVCFYVNSGDIYEFAPNTDYCGAFDSLLAKGDK